MTINIPKTDKKRIVIIGGGFGGLTLARSLVKSDYQIVLIDKNNYHQFQPLFYQVAMAGLEPSSIAFPLRKTFQNKKNVIIRVAEVQKINTQEKCIYTTLGPLEYDYLVLAIGADTNFFGNENIATKAIPMKSVAQALFLRNAILKDYENAITEMDYDKRQSLIDIVIVGGGPTGVEIAGALAEMRTYILPKDYPELNCDEIDIHLIQGGDRLLQGMSEKSSQSADEFLKRLGVQIKYNTRVTDFDGEKVYMNDDTTITTNKVIWAAGIIGNKIEGLDADTLARGRRIRVDAYNQVLGQDSIFAIGDIAYHENETYPYGHPQVAQVAIQQARTLAKNFKRITKSKPLKTFSYHDKGSMATVGRHLAVVDLPKFSFRGVFAWFIWLLVHLFALIGTKNKVFVFLNWVWNYVTYDQSLRLLIKPHLPKQNVVSKG